MAVFDILLDKTELLFRRERGLESSLSCFVERL